MVPVCAVDIAGRPAPCGVLVERVAAHGEVAWQDKLTINVALNAEQRRATASLLTRDITVVTGPPGTGKSQVVSSTVANARLSGLKVV